MSVMQRSTGSTPTTLIGQHRVRHHLFADDMQGIKHSKPSNVRDVTAGLGACICDVCEQLVRVEALSAEHQENRGDVVGLQQTSGKSRLSTKTFSSDPTSYHHLLLSVISECSSTQNST